MSPRAAESDAGAGLSSESSNAGLATNVWDGGRYRSLLTGGKAVRGSAAGGAVVTRGAGAAGATGGSAAQVAHEPFPSRIGWADWWQSPQWWQPTAKPVSRTAPAPSQPRGIGNVNMNSFLSGRGPVVGPRGLPGVLFLPSLSEAVRD